MNPARRRARPGPSLPWRSGRRLLGSPALSTPSSSSTVAGASAPRPLKLGVIFLTLYIDLVGFSIIFPLFPSMLEYYIGKEGNAGFLGAVLGSLDHVAAWMGGGDHYTPVLFGGFLGSLYSVLQFIFAPIWGGLSDKHGRRRVLLITCAGTVFSYFLWIFSGSFLLLVLARLFGGAMSGNLSVATAAVADVTTRESRAKGMGMVGAAFGLGFVTGPAIGGITAHFNLLPGHPGWSAWGINPFSVPALIAMLLAVLNLVWIAARFRESLPATARAKLHPVRDRNPLRMLRTHLDAAAQRTNLVYFLFILAFSGMEFSLAFFAADRFAFNTTQITQMMVFIGLVLIVTQGAIVRRLVPKLGEKVVAFGGLILVGAGFLLLSMASTVTFLYTALGCLALGSGCATPALTALVSLAASPEKQGQTLGAFRALGSLARALGPFLAAAIYWSQSPAFAYRAGAVLLIIALAMTFGLPGGPMGGERPG